MTVVADDWLGALLGKPAYHVAAGDALPAGRAFFDAKVPVQDIDALLALQATGFAVMDTNVQLARDPATPAPSAPASEVRFALPDDEPAVRCIAGHELTENRFHRDPAVGPAIGSRIKAEWAGNFFSGKRGNWMVVAERDGAVCGFLQALAGPGPDSVVIDLIAVAGDAQGRGVGRALIAHAASVCLGRPARLLVGTQVANIPSLALYAAVGFRIVSATYVLHRHQEAT